MNLDDRKKEMLDAAKGLREVLSRLTAIPRVLLVDDCETDNELAQKVFEKFRCDLTIEKDPTKAIRLIARSNFDVVMIDIVMPKVDGIQLLEQAMAGESRPAMIMVTGIPDAPIVSKAIKAGAKLILDKPLNAEKLDLILTRKQSYL